MALRIGRQGDEVLPMLLTEIAEIGEIGGIDRRMEFGDEEVKKAKICFGGNAVVLRDGENGFFSLRTDRHIF